MPNGTLELQTENSSGVTNDGLIVDGDSNVSIPNGNFTVDTNTLKVDSTNNRVGIGTTSPSAKLHVDGDTIVSGVLIVTGNIDSPSITSLNTSTGVLNTNVIGLQTATGSLKSDISSNDSDIASLQTATGLILTSGEIDTNINTCLLYTSPSPRDGLLSRMPSSA